MDVPSPAASVPPSDRLGAKAPTQPLESFLVSLSAAFVKVCGADAERQIDEWLGNLARFLEVERCTLWEFSADGTTLHRQHYSAPGFEVPTPDLSSGRFRWLTEQSLHGSVIAWARVPDDVPPEAAGERSYLIERGDKAVLSVPALSGTSLYILIVASSAERAEWSEALVFGLRLAGAIFASAIERARAEVALQAIEVRHRAVLRALPEMMFVISPAGVFLDYYARNESDLLSDPSTFLGRHVGEVLPEEVNRGLWLAHERALERGEAVTHEFELAIKGRVRQFESRMVRREDRAIVSVVRDITKDMQQRIENERLRLELAHAGRVVLMGYLTASLAHELRQPLTAVLSNSQCAQRYLDKADHDPEELRSIVSDIAQSSLRAAAQVNRIRGFLKKERRPYHPVDLNRLASEIAKVLQSELIARRVQLVLELAPSLPSVQGDSIELQQVMLNLLLNGAEAMEGNPPSDRVLVLRTLLRAERVQVSVCDRGPGVAPANLQRLFEPFFSTKPEGIGMGLSISSDIVRAHGGALCAERLETGGMHFYFALPAESSEGERPSA